MAKMKHLTVGLAFLMVIAVHADETQFSNDYLVSNDEGREKIVVKRALEDNIPFKQLFDSLWSSKTSSGVGQEKVKNEKTFKDFIIYEALQSVLLNALKPKPIVDTALDSEKLAPNFGTKAQVLGDWVVKGSETLSKALNSVIDGPKKAITQFSAGATQALNQFGAYLIGL